jgi:hypothetical protein
MSAAAPAPPRLMTNDIKFAHRNRLFGRKAMEWFNRKTSIAGVQIPNWGVVLILHCNLARAFR